MRQPVFKWLLVVVAPAACALLPAIAAAQEKTQSGSKVVATVQGAPITEGELQKAAAADLEKLELQKLQFEARYERGKQQVLEQSLDRLIEDRLLQLEAAKRGIKVQELLVAEVNIKVKEPTAADVDAYYEAYKQNIGAPKEQVADQIQQFLRQQNQNKARAAFVQQLKRMYSTESWLEPLRIPVETAGRPVRGPADASVSLVEFSDFQCSFCKALTATLVRVQKDFASQVRLTFRQFPIANIHPEAQKAAEASLCAGEQGRFWEMHDLLFQQQDRLKAEDLKAKAAELKLDADAFGACLASGKYAEQIRQDTLDGTRAGVTGTPALFINGRPITGAQPYEEIARIIQDELKRKVK